MPGFLSRQAAERAARRFFQPRIYLPAAFLILLSAAGALFAEAIPFFWLFAAPAALLLCFEAPLWLWAAAALSLSILHGEIYFWPGQLESASPQTLWPESLRHLRLFALTAFAYGALALARPYLISLPLCLMFRACLLGRAGSRSRACFDGRAGSRSPAAAETEALEAGGAWIESEFFKSRPDFQKIFSQSFCRPGGFSAPGQNRSMTEDERAFFRKEASELCGLSSEWEIIRTKQFPESIIEALKAGGFWGMIIPKKYGGRGFSPLAHARVIEKIASANLPAAVVAMVPSSLGPAELILRYGTAWQKNKYLKRLASGSEIPCFGLTEDQAGSDAGAISSDGVLFRGGDGRLKLRLNWRKRWITLAPKATLIGLAFQLKDPDGLLPEEAIAQGAGARITCALVPAGLPGVEAGRYHDSSGIPFFNGPMLGKDVILDAEKAIIGGLPRAGRGWKMLMESLAAGRAVSIPSLCIGCAGRISRLTSAHAAFREQFGRPIGDFEGLQEPLARIAGFLYLMKAAQDMTLSALNQGLRPAAASAITKYQLTELARKISAGGMDIMGGAGLSLGPKNLINNVYRALPITITVEGANILTRTFIIYGQGLFQARPDLREGAKALKAGDFKAFDRLLWSGLYQALCGAFRFAALFLTRGRAFAPAAAFPPGFFQPSKISKAGISKKESRLIQKLARRSAQKLAWASALFFCLSSLSLLLGRSLKVRGRLTGRFADMLSHLYMASAALARCQARSGGERLAAEWALARCFSQIQKAGEGIAGNFPLPPPLSLLRAPFAMLLRLNPLSRPPSDKLSGDLARALIKDDDFRKTLHSNLHCPQDPEHQIQKLERARAMALRTEAPRRKIKQDVRRGILPKKRISDLADEALKAGTLSQKEHESLIKARAACREAIQTDSFSEEEYLNLRPAPEPSQPPAR